MGTLAQNAAALLASATMAGGSTGHNSLLQIDCGSQFCKAFPEVEGGQRVLYMQASTPSIDSQNERILTDALMESKDWFLKHGRIDLDHATVWKLIRDTELDPGNPYIREIGIPKEVILKHEKGEPSVWVKAEIFQSKNPNNQATKAADWFWETLELEPPMPWYPSVAGSLLPGGTTETFENGKKIRTINKLRWHSIGLTRTPINSNLSTINTVPMGAFVKALLSGDPACESFAVAGQDADQTLNQLGIKVPSGDVGSMPLGLITPEKLERIRNCIKQNESDNSLQLLSKLGAIGISPVEGMAVLIALLDNSRVSGGV
jgi:hypothetical protein